MSNIAAVAAPNAPRSESWVRRSYAWLFVRKNEDLVVSILLALAALATSWSSYQASIWSGVQARQYNVANGYRTRAARLSEDAARQRMIDIALFTKWLDAYVDERTQITAFYETHFRPEFKPAFAAWRAGGSKALASSTPFEQPEYHVAKEDQATAYDTAALRVFEAGRAANTTADTYTFGTVMLASVLFFAGAVRTKVSSHWRVAALLAAVVICVSSVVRLATLPIAR